MEKRIGKIQKGFAADLVAVAGNPLEDISTVEAPLFVMKEGKALFEKASEGAGRAMINGLGTTKMHRAGFRQLDIQLQDEFFGRVPPSCVPSYSGERNAAERVVRRIRELHPEWRQEITEDHWGYTVTWLCPWPAGRNRAVPVGEHRSPVLPVALCRAALNAHRNYERYEYRRRLRTKEGETAPSPAARQSS